MKTIEKSSYDISAEKFLTRFGISFRAALSDSKPAPWDVAGHHYRVTLSRSIDPYDQSTGREYPKRLTFDFWGCRADLEAGIKAVSAYSILSCIASDVHCPDTLEEFCAEYGGDENELETQQTFRRASKFALRLKAFFTPEEIEALGEIDR